MIFRAAIYTLIAALSLATTPAFACTGISLKAGDGAAIRARTLEFGFPLKSNVIVVPAGKEFSATLPDGGKGLTYKSRYDVIGANAFGAVIIVDGLNSQGLSMGLFYFPVCPIRDGDEGERLARACATGFRSVGAWQLRHGR